MINYNETLKAQYQHLYDTGIIKPAKYKLIDTITDKQLLNKSRYQNVGDITSVPWYFIAIIHQMECNLNFSTHLHNGDPLKAKTIHVPRNRPSKKQPPFTWEDSAIDAITMQGLLSWSDWTLPGLLFKLEAYNGFGYRRASIKIPSPYLWSFSNHYSKGKFVADGRFNSQAVSIQCGAAVLLRRLEERQLISIPKGDKMQKIKELCSTTTFNPNVVVEDVIRLQTLLSALGYPLRLDGKAGEKTSNVCKVITGVYLKNDPRLKK